MNACSIFAETYAAEKAMVHTKTQWILILAFLAFLGTVPLFISSSWLITLNWFVVTIVAVIGLQLLTGCCGQISLAHYSFVGVGAFAGGILAERVGLPFLACLILAGIVSGLVGLIFGIPSLRVKGLYLALATLGAYLFFTWLFKYWGFLGGMRGIWMPPLTLWGLTIDSDVSFYYLALAVCLLAIFLAINLMRTKWGRAWIAIRDSENAAGIMGINVYGYKLLAFFIACFYAGIGGCLFAYYQGAINWTHFTFLWDSLWYVGMITVGGIGSIAGVVIGVIVIKGLFEVVIRYILPAIPFLGVTEASVVGNLICALVIILILIFEPRGLMHRWEVFKASYRLWPFARRS